MAGNGPQQNGPADEWATDAKRKLVLALMRSGTSTPEQFERVLKDANLRGADLSDAYVRFGNVVKRIASE